MRAAQLIKYGGKDSVKVNQDVAKPSPAEGEVLVAVQAAAVNPFDIKVREGVAHLNKGVDFPATLGGDVAGEVAEIGPGVTGFEIGEAVYGQAGALSGKGSFAEFTPVKAKQLAAKPKSLDFTKAAALPLVSASAYQALVEHIGLQKGQKILIHGGGGGIGSVAIQLAKHIGAHVATTARGDEADFVKNLGADEVIDYETQDFSQLLKDYDAVYDTVGGETNQKSYQVLKNGGSMVSMVAPPDEELVKQKDVKYTAQGTNTSTDKLTKIAELVDQGVLKIEIDKVFPFDQAAEALEYQKTGHPKGKVVIDVTTEVS